MLLLLQVLSRDIRSLHHRLNLYPVGKAAESTSDTNGSNKRKGGSSKHQAGPPAPHEAALRTFALSAAAAGAASGEEAHSTAASSAAGASADSGAAAAGAGGPGAYHVVLENIYVSYDSECATADGCCVRATLHPKGWMQYRLQECQAAGCSFVPLVFHWTSAWLRCVGQFVLGYPSSPGPVLAGPRGHSWRVSSHVLHPWPRSSLPHSPFQSLLAAWWCCGTRGWTPSQPRAPRCPQRDGAETPIHDAIPG